MASNILLLIHVLGCDLVYYFKTLVISQAKRISIGTKQMFKLERKFSL